MSTAAAALTATAEIDIATVDAVNLNHGGGGGIGCSHCGCRCRGMIDNDELLQKQRQQEEDLQAAVEITSLFEDFMQFGSVGLHIVDDSGTILWANKAELDLLGYREDEYIGKPIMQFHADQSCVQEILTTLLAGQRVENYIAPILCRDGHVEYVQINSSMRQVDGKCVTTRCFSACVTDRVLREQAQLQAMAKEKEAQLIQEQAKRKTEFLRSLCHELRNPLNGISGNLDLLLCELKELQCELQDAFDAVKQAQKDHQGVTAAHAPTTKYELREHGLEAAKAPPAPVTPATSKPLLLLVEGATATSTTGTNKRKLPQDQIASKTQQRIADALDFAKSAQLAAEHQMLVINDTLSLSRLESTKGQLDFSPKPVYIPTLIQSVTAILGVKAQEKKVRLLVEMLQEESLQVRTDPVWFKQILINLISNAIKFVDSDRGEVVVKVQQKEHPQQQNRLQQVALEVAVQDNGIGMTPEEQAKLFGVFAQANEKISAQFGGSGLGLHIVKQLLDHVGGTIHVESEKGVGTTFSFCLPCGPPLKAQELAKLVEQANSNCGDDRDNKNKKPRLSSSSSSSSSSNNPLSSASASPAAATAKQSIKVLVVDDSHINLKILSNFLRKRGYAHELAENGQIALEKFQQSNFDIILTDVQMPKMNGLEMTRNIRQHEEKQLRTKPPVPIIGISGNVLPEDAASARQVGMNEYVGKPYRFADLEALMREHLALP